MGALSAMRIRNNQKKRAAQEAKNKKTNNNRYSYSKPYKPSTTRYNHSSNIEPGDIKIESNAINIDPNEYQPWMLDYIDLPPSKDLPPSEAANVCQIRLEENPPIQTKVIENTTKKDEINQPAKENNTHIKENKTVKQLDKNEKNNSCCIVY